MFVIAFACSCSFIISFLLTEVYRRIALKWEIFDIPNERSAHKDPIPRGAGIAFFITMNLVLFTLIHFKQLSPKYTYPVFLGGPSVVLLGYWDDIKSVWPLFRLLVHFLVAVLVFSLVSAGFTREVTISFLPAWGWLTQAFCILFITWFINLYNFMDGADGMACTMGMVGAGLIAILSYLQGNVDLSIIYTVLAYALAGFLVFNWPPAKVFMGDAGAYYLGYIFGSLALVSKMYYDSSLYVHLIIFGFFIVDATWTLIRRLARGEKVYRAHQLHAFQKLLGQGWGHARVTALYVLGTVLWLFPMAAFSMSFQEYSFLFLVIAYIPVFAFVLWARAGAKEV